MSLSGEVEGTTILFLAGLVLTCGALLLRTHRQLGSRAKSGLPSPATFAPPKPAPPVGAKADAPPEVAHWQVEMHDLARELQSQLDSKIVILRHLLADAQTQSDRLDDLIARAADLTQAPQTAESAGEGCLRVDAAAANGGTHASRRHAEIYSLADAGLSSSAIAARVGSPIGEIELILGLRRRGT